MPALGIRRQIGTELIGSCSGTIQGLSVRVAVRLEAYQFGWQYGASDRVGSHVYWREILLTGLGFHRRIGVALVVFG